MSVQTVVIAAPSVYSYGNIQGSDGAIQRFIGASFTSTRIATGRYQITFNSSLGNDVYGILLTVEDSNNRDSIEIHYINRNQNGFEVWIHEGDNGGAANVYRDRNFTFYITHE